MIRNSTYSTFIKLLCIVLLFAFAADDSKAQDAHFSQFYSAPLLLNPALAGTMDGTFRIASVYRDQWRSALEQPLKQDCLI